MRTFLMVLADYNKFLGRGADVVPNHNGNIVVIFPNLDKCLDKIKCNLVTTKQ